MKEEIKIKPIIKQMEDQDPNYLDDLIKHSNDIITAEEKRIEQQKAKISDLRSARVVHAQEIFDAEDTIKIIQGRIGVHKKDIERYSTMRNEEPKSSL